MKGHNFRLVQIGSACILSSPEHEVLRVSYCDSAVFVMRRVSCGINFLPCEHSRGHIFSPIILKRGQDVFLDEISDEFENGSCRLKKLGQ